MFFEKLEERALLHATLFSDTFESGNISTSRWPSTGFSTAEYPVVKSESSSLGPIKASGSYAAAFFGNDFINDGFVGMQSKKINLSSYVSSTLSYKIQAEGNGNSPESHEDLFVQYRKSNGSWVTLKREDQSAVSHSSFTSRSFALPSAARHSKAAFRFYATGLDGERCSGAIIEICLPASLDHWFIDNVKLTGNRVPSISFTNGTSGTDASSHKLSWKTSDPDGDSVSSVTAELLKGSTVLRSSTAKKGDLTVKRSDGPGSYRLRVTAKDSHGAKVTRHSSILKIKDDDIDPPAITLSGSSGTESASQDQRFTWGVSDDTGSTSEVTITKEDFGVIFSRSYDADFASDSFDFNAYGVGSYTITINALDKDDDRSGDQLSATESRIVNVINAPPVARFSVPTVVSDRTEGAAIQFDAAASSDPEGDPLTYVWNFGDGRLGRGESITHTYADNGTYTIELTVVDSFHGASSQSQSIIVSNVAPVAAASAPGQVDEMSAFALELDVADPGADTATIHVDWGDGQSDEFATDGEKTHVYTDGGNTYTVRVSLEDEDGSYADAATHQVSVAEAPPVLSGLPPFFTSQANEAVLFSVAATDGTDDLLTYAWAFGDGGSVAGPDKSAVSHAYTADGQYDVTLTVSDSDGFATVAHSNVAVGSPVTFTTAGQSVPESAGAVTVRARLENGLPLAQDVKIPLLFGGDVDGGDFDAPAALITIEAGQLESAATVEIVDDLLDEDDERLVLTMGLTEGSSHGTIARHEVTIQDNDASPSVFFADGGGILDEGDGRFTLEAALSTPSGRDVVVPIGLSGTASLGADYQPDGDSQVVIPAGASSGQLEIVIVDDDRTEAAETIVATMQGSAQAVLSTETGRGTVTSRVIAQNDAPIVSLDSAYRLTTEDAGAIEIRSRLSRFTDEWIVVPYTISGTATHRADYFLVHGAFQFAPGSSVAKVGINITDDLIAEGIENILIQLEPVANANLGTSQSILTDILDNDQVRVSLEAGDLARFEGTSQIPIRVQLSNTSSSSTIVPLDLSGTASSGTDFTITTTSIVVPAGSSEGTAYVDLLDDDENEPPETLFITLGDIVGGVAGTTTLKTVTVKDTDPLVTLFSSKQNLTEGDAPLKMAVRLSAPTDEPLTVPLRYSGTARRNDDYTAPNSITIAAGATLKPFSLSVVDDTTAESRETITVTLGSPSAGQTVQPKAATMKLGDNDVAPTVFWGRRQYSVAEDSGERHITVGLSAASGADVSVALTYASAPSQVIEADLGSIDVGLIGSIDLDLSQPIGGAIPNSDFRPVTTTVTIPAGETSAAFTVPIVDNELKESRESFVIRMTSATNASLPVDPSLHQTKVSIFDDDQLSAVQLQLVGEQVRQSVTSSDSSSNGFPSWRDLLGGFQDAARDAGQKDGDTCNPNTQACQDLILDWILIGVGFIPIPGLDVAAVVTQHLRDEYPDGNNWINTNDVARDAGRCTAQNVSAENCSFFIDLAVVIGEHYFFKYLGAQLGEFLSGSIGEFGEYVGKGIVALGRYVGENVSEEDIVNGLHEAGDAIGGGVEDLGNALCDGCGTAVVSMFGGYGDGVEIFFDVDFNGVRSATEPFAETTADGFAVVRGIESADADNNGVLDFAEGQWVAQGGVDTSVGQAFPIPFVAPANYGRITPTSTLVSKLIGSGAFPRTGTGVRQAESRLLGAAGVPDRRLAGFDFVQATANGDADAALLFARETQFYNTVVMAASAFANRATSLPFAFAADLAISDIASKITPADASLRLASRTVVENILNGMRVRTGADFAPGVLQGIADVIARSNEEIEDVPVEGSESYLRAVVKVHRLAHGTLRDRVRQVAEGQLSLSEFQNATGDLASLLADVQAVNVLPVYLGIDDARVLEGDGPTQVLEFTVTPYGTSALPLSVKYQTTGGTALSGDDFTAAAGTLSWDAFDSTPRTIQVAVQGDDALEADEFMSVVLSDAEHATLATAVARGTILNDDAFLLETPANESNEIVVSIEGPRIRVAQDGQSVLEGSYENGAVIRLNTHASDTLRLHDEQSMAAASVVALDGTRTIELSGHRIEIQGAPVLVDTVTAAVSGLPDPIFAEKELVLEPVVPESFEPGTLAFQWQYLPIDGATAIVAGTEETFRFTPQISGDYRVQVQVSDGVRTSTAIHQVHVFPPNVPPVAVPDFADVTENQAASVDVIANDTDLNVDDVLSLVAGSVQLVSMTRDADGTAIDRGTSALSQIGNTVRFDPAADFDFLASGESATVVIQYIATDDNVFPLSDEGVLTIYVSGTNDRPRAIADAATTLENDSIQFDVIANDQDVDATDELSLVAGSASLVSLTRDRDQAPVPPGAALVGQAGDLVTFDPGTAFDFLATGETATVAVRYTVTDDAPGALTDEGLLQITVAGRNDRPQARDDAGATGENTPVSTDVVANDTDPDLTDVLALVPGSAEIVSMTRDLDGAPIALGDAAVSEQGNTVTFAPGTDFDFLAVGETASVRIDYSVRDDDAQPLADLGSLWLRIDGRNDDPALVQLTSSNETLAARGSTAQPVVIEGSFTDVDLSDRHTVTFRWGDDSPPETHSATEMDLSASGRFEQPHRYATGGIYTIIVTVDDGHDGTATDTTQAVITGVGVVDRTLYVIGTDGKDIVNVNEVGGKNRQVKVIANLDVKKSDTGKQHLRPVVPRGEVDRIEMYLLGDDDHAVISQGGPNVPALLFGGPGDDHLVSGAGDDILSGGSGDDRLDAGAGVDLLIGGMGGDQLDGGRGNDLLIAGSAAAESSPAALQAALASWTAGDLEQARLRLGAITEDDDKDKLFGGQGDDALFGDAGDLLAP